MPALLDLKNDMKDLSTKALALVDDTDKTPAEKREELDKIEPEIKALSGQIADLEHIDEKRAEFLAAQGLASGQGDPGADAGAAGQGFKSIGQQFVESAEFKALAESGQIGTQNWTSGAVEVKANMTEAASPIIAKDYLDRPPTTINLQPPNVADLIPQGSTVSNTVRYLKETTATNAADTVAEGGTKPESTLVLVEVNESVRKIATTLPISDEMLEDWDQTRSYVDQRLMQFLKIAENDQLLNGTTTPPDLVGILNRTGLQTATALGSDTRPDAVYKAITTIRSNAFVEPDGMVIHPSDWQDFRLAKDQNLQYYGGGPFTGAYGNGGLNGQTMFKDTFWGLNVVITTAIAAGTALVGAFGTETQIFRKGGIRIDATNSHASEFLSNITRLRIEERLALAVYRPGGFGTVTGL
jgi:HK97 family phage major capsid protein